MDWIDNKTILTATSGFLASGYTHTINGKTQDREEKVINLAATGLAGHKREEASL